MYVLKHKARLNHYEEKKRASIAIKEIIEDHIKIISRLGECSLTLICSRNQFIIFLTKIYHVVHIRLMDDAGGA